MCKTSFYSRSLQITSEHIIVGQPIKSGTGADWEETSNLGQKNGPVSSWNPNLTYNAVQIQNNWKKIIKI